MSLCNGNSKIKSNKSEALNESDWDKLKTIQHMTLLKLRNVCDKYELNYIMIGGTLLGAVRHRGYIPWDDDIDVGMLRSDFDKLLSLSKDNFGDDFFVQYYATDEGYPSPLLKIRVNGTLSLQRSCEHVKNMNHGIWIDIFPFDNSPDLKISIKIYKKILYITKCIMYFGCGYSVLNKNRKGYHALSIAVSITKLLPKKIKIGMCVRVMKMYNSLNKHYVSSTMSGYDYEKYRIPKEYFTDTVLLDFEGFKFKAPRNYHQMLTQLYGDYMQLPPVEERCKNVEMFSEVSFGKYENIKSIYDACSIAGVEFEPHQ